MAEFIEIISEKAFKDIDSLNKKLSKMDLNVNEISKKFQSIVLPSELKDILKEIAKETKKSNEVVSEAVKIQKKLKASEDALALSKSKVGKQIIKNRVEASKSNSTSRQLAKISSTLSTEYERQSAKLIVLKKRQKDLNTQKVLGGKLSKLQSAELKKLNLQVNNLDTALKKVDAQSGEFGRSVGNYPAMLGSASKAARSLAQNLGLIGGASLIAAGIRDAIQTIIKFDRQLIAVSKTTNIIGDDLKQLGKDIILLGLNTKGVSIEGLLKSAEVAGQLGVKGSANILKFSKTIELLALTSDIIGEDSVRNFAKFIEVSNDTVSNADRLGSVITDLGNNFATTENQVLNNATEIQKGISIYEASAQSVLGLGAATSSLGLQAEQARSGIQSTFLVLEDAVNGGESLTEVLKVTGLTQKQLSDQFKKDATGVFEKFVSGLNDIRLSGGSVTKTLKGLNLNNKQSINTLGALSKNYKTLKEALKSADLEYTNNIALTKEAEAASKSIAERIKDIGDAWDAFILAFENGSGPLAKGFGVLLNNVETLLKGFRRLALSGDEELNEIFDTKKAESYAAALQEINREAKASGSSQLSVAKEIFEGNIGRFNQIQEELKLLKERRVELEKQKEEISVFNVVQSGGINSELSENEKQTERATLALAVYEGQVSAAQRVLSDYAKVQRESNEVSEDEVDVNKGKAKELDKISKQRIKNAFNLARQRLNFEIEAQKNIVDNEKISGDSRITANSKLLDASKRLNVLEKNFAISNAKGRANEIIRINEEFANKTLKNNKTQQENNLKIFKDSFNQRIALLQGQFDDEDLQLKLREATLKNELLKKGVLEEEAERQVTEVINAEKQKQTELFIKALRDQLKFKDITAEEEKQVNEAITNLEIKLLDKVSRKYSDNAEERRRQREQERQEVQEIFGILGDTLGFSSGNLSDIFDGIKNGFESSGDAAKAFGQLAGEAIGFLGEQQQIRFEAEIERLDKEKEVALAFAGEDAEARGVIEEDFAEKKAALQTKQAQADKDNALFRVAIDTATAVVAALAIGPKGIPLAFTVGALGAAQAALIASRPIPEFAQGTDFAPGGLSLVNDQKGASFKETIITPKGDILKPQKRNTLIDLPRGSVVKTAKESIGFNQQLDSLLENNGIIPMSSKLPNNIVVESNNGISKDEMMLIMSDTLAKMPVNSLSLDKNGFHVYSETAMNKTKKLNNRTSFKGKKV